LFPLVTVSILPKGLPYGSISKEDFEKLCKDIQAKMNTDQLREDKERGDISMSGFCTQKEFLLN